ncbi:hypothetical protein CYY_005729 [Polysphondylium violaceum]|uniref:Uncharacterized protein n=1 Tax=Polysphondylium violaceum TaxID=133409 RepID=A0A8J4PRH7_9MYCE|nr:hypothetical protein CYY_005729 [Polysphondylium violaceum]
MDELSHYPGSYFDIDYEANDRIDFQDDGDQGLNVTIDKSYKDNHINIHTSPFAVNKFSISNTAVEGQVFEASISRDQNENVLELSHVGELLKGVTSHVFVSVPQKELKQTDGVATLTLRNHRTNFELKGSTQNNGLLGFSLLHGVKSNLAVGFELYYKLGQNSGGASVATRYRGNLINKNHQYQLTSTYNIMGDLSASISLGIIPQCLSLSTRYNLNTSSMTSTLQIGTQILATPKIMDKAIPICLKLKTDTELNHAVRLEFEAPLFSVSLGSYSNKQSKNFLSNYGIGIHL